jgi:aminoglycoside phosphotransferase (APT) family kinase protein
MTSEIGAITDDVGVDLDVLGELLRDKGIRADPPFSAVRVGRGQSNLTYLVEDGGGARWIVRRPPRGHLLDSAHDVLREYRILSALQGTDVPVPAVVAEFTDPKLAETPVVVMAHVDGLVVDRQEVAEATSPELRRALGPSLARTLAKIHEVDLAKVRLADLASHAPYAARQVKRWSRQWEASRTRDLPALDRLTALLTRTMPAQRELTLVHGDFHIRNVIVGPETGGLRAVLDWELSTLGDPLADIGSLLAYWAEAADAPTGLFTATTLPGFVGRREVAETYLTVSGRDGTDLDYWHVLGLWKIAVIAEGILRRALDEPANAAEGGPPQQAHIDALVDRAWTTAHAARLGR